MNRSTKHTSMIVVFRKIKKHSPLLMMERDEFGEMEEKGLC